MSGGFFVVQFRLLARSTRLPFTPWTTLDAFRGMTKEQACTKRLFFEKGDDNSDMRKNAKEYRVIPDKVKL